MGTDARSDQTGETEQLGLDEAGYEVWEEKGWVVAHAIIERCTNCDQATLTSGIHIPCTLPRPTISLEPPGVVHSPCYRCVQLGIESSCSSRRSTTRSHTFFPPPLRAESLAKVRHDDPLVASYPPGTGPLPRLPISRTSLHGISWAYDAWQIQVGKRHLDQLIKHHHKSGKRETGLKPSGPREELAHLYAVRLDAMTDTLRGEAVQSIGRGHGRLIARVVSDSESESEKIVEIGSEQEPKDEFESVKQSWARR